MTTERKKNSGNPHARLVNRRPLGQLLSYLILTYTLTSACLAGAPAESIDWPHWRGPDHNGISKETDWHADWDPDQGPNIAWRKEIGTGFSSMALDHGKLYAMGNTGQKKGDKNAKDVIYCLDAKTGKTLWTYEYPCPLDPKYYEGGPSATPTVNNTHVYTLSKEGDLLCLDANSGKLIWQKHLQKDWNLAKPDWGFASSVLCVKDKLIINVGTSGIAVCPKDGSLLWCSGKDTPGYASPVPYQLKGTDYVACFGANTVYGVKVEDGKVLWQYLWKTPYDENITDPIIQTHPDGIDVYISSGMNTGCSMLRINSDHQVKLLWQNKEMRSHLSSGILWQNHLYGFDETNLKCLDSANGQVKWDQDGLGKGTLMLTSDGRMILLSDKGKLVIARANPQQYQPLIEADILSGRCWTVPVLSGGFLYARNAQGSLVALDLRTKTSPPADQKTETK